MDLIIFLILFPLLAAILLLFIKQDHARKCIVITSVFLIICAAIILSVNYIHQPWQGFIIHQEILDTIAGIVGITLAFVIFVFSIKFKNKLAGILACIQLCLHIAFEVAHPHVAPLYDGLYIDSLSIIMVLIIAIIGGGICIYSLGYMQDMHDHKVKKILQESTDQQAAPYKDKRNFFFSLLFIFLSAMFIIVCSNNVTWMYAGWEITTLCSFLLISYTKTHIAIKNAFRQIIMNMVGGIAFLIAMYLMAYFFGTLSFQDFIDKGLYHPEFASIIVLFFSIAGITKAAQMPFHTWLLGAMVAPTPTSALLHSSTMVKAGVFILIKMAPLYAICIIPSKMVIIVGGVTFLLCSLLAISKTNAKLVLAYSTIANLGLIVACAGVGTPESIWAAILLLIFHALAKSLLFCCVGSAEHRINSRDIEDMDYLFDSLPTLSRLMMLGILCMFIAPFGMLIAKWATLNSFIENGQFLLLFCLAFGSAATFMFWAKWLGKLSGTSHSIIDIGQDTSRYEKGFLWSMAILLILTCLTLPLISYYLIDAYTIDVFQKHGFTITNDYLLIAGILTVIMSIIMLIPKKQSLSEQSSIYLSGVGIDSPSRTFINSFSKPSIATAKNMYLQSLFGEKYLKPAGEIICALCIFGFLFIEGITIIF